MALSTPIIPKEITFAGSPQFIVVQETGAGASQPVEIYVDIYTWQGPLGGVPTEPTTTLIAYVQSNPAGTATATFEVSKYLLANIEADVWKFTSDFAPTSIGTAATWFRLDVRSSETNTLQGQVKYATSGKGRYSQGQNPGALIEDYDNLPYGTQGKILIADTSRNYILPVFIGLTSQNEGIETQFGYKPFTDFGIPIGELQNQDSGKQIYYISIGPDTIAEWQYGLDLNVAVSDTSEIVRELFQYKIRCHSGRAKSLKYINMAGAVSDFPINGSDLDSESLNKITFNNEVTSPSVGGYDPLRHAKRTFYVQSRKTVNLETGWIFEESKEMVQELLYSQYSWFELSTGGDSIEVYPSYITNVQQRFIRRMYQDQVGYQITIEKAVPEINTVY